MDENVVNRVEVEKPRIIKNITLDEINQEKVNHETDYIKISQNQYTDKAVNVTVVTGEIVTQMQTMHRVGEGNLTSEFGLDLRYSERQYAT